MVLLDTNVLSVWLYTGNPSWNRIDSWLKSLGSTQIAASEVTRGEIEYGLALGALSEAAKTEMRSKIDAMTLFWQPVDDNVSATYGLIRAALFDKYSPRTARGNIQYKRVELLPVPPVTGGQLQIEENDLWIASTAIALDVQLVTCEAGISRILDVAPSSLAYAHSLLVP